MQRGSDMGSASQFIHFINCHEMPSTDEQDAYSHLNVDAIQKAHRKEYRSGIKKAQKETDTGQVDMELI